MKATQLLKQQHKEVEDLFARLEKAEGRSKRSIFEEIAQNLVAHDGIERQLFYPACKSGMGMTDDLAEALVEHGVVEFCLYQADEAAPGDEFDAKAKVLRETLEHHIEEEEEEFFPKVEKALGSERLEKLGAEMKARFEELKGASFRPPLHANLRQVLAGAMETKPPEKKSPPKAAGKAAKKPAARKPTARKAATKRGATGAKKRGRLSRAA